MRLTTFVHPSRFLFAAAVSTRRSRCRREALQRAATASAAPKAAQGPAGIPQKQQQQAATPIAWGERTCCE
eukprot:6870-Eustigmatos_ZCMA.PRE.1